MRPGIALSPSVGLLIIRGRTWWEARAPREQALLLCLATVLLLSIAFGGFLRPLQEARAAARAEIRLHDGLAARIRAAGSGLKAPTTGTLRSGPVQMIVTTTASESALQIRQIEQQGAVTNVVLDAADFTRLVQWLDRLDRDAGVTVAAASIERQTLPGVVNARLSLVRR